MNPHRLKDTEADHSGFFEGLDLEDSIKVKYMEPEEGVIVFNLLPVRNSMRFTTLFVIMMLSYVGLNLMWMTDAKAQSSPATPQKGSANVTTAKSLSVDSEKTIKADPVCDPSHRPKITKIEPDEFQAGAKVVIMGEDFGQKKECLHEVTFGMEKAKEFMLKSDNTIEATAPDNVAPGMIFVSVVTGGGAAKAAVLVKK